MAPSKRDWGPKSAFWALAVGKGIQHMQSSTFTSLLTNIVQVDWSYFVLWALQNLLWGPKRALYWPKRRFLGPESQIVATEFSDDFSQLQLILDFRQLGPNPALRSFSPN